jgi:hypothetical protein
METNPGHFFLFRMSGKKPFKLWLLIKGNTYFGTGLVVDLQESCESR